MKNLPAAAFNYSYDGSTYTPFNALKVDSSVLSVAFSNPSPSIALATIAFAENIVIPAPASGTALTVDGNVAVTGNIKATVPSYPLPDLADTAQFIHLGTWSTIQGGAKLRLQVTISQGYNAQIGQNAVYDIFFKTSNAIDNQAGSSGSYYADGTYYGIGGAALTAVSGVLVVQNSQTSYDFYINCTANAYSGDSFYEVAIASDTTWTHSGAPVGTGVPAGNYIYLSRELKIGGEVTINGVAGQGSLALLSTNTGGVLDLYIQRTTSTQNQIANGPCIQLTDTSNTNVNNTIIQQSGGQTEFWQTIAGVGWEQLAVFGTDGNFYSRKSVMAQGGGYYSGSASNQMLLDQGDGWLRINQAGNFGNGIYTPHNIRTDASYFVGPATYLSNVANVLTYGSIFVNGGTNTYTGYAIYDGGRYPTFMSNNSLCGVYGQGNAYWMWYDNGTNFVIGKPLTNPSDSRLKTNVAPITSALSKVNQLNGVTFDLLDVVTLKDTGQRSTGLLAQDVQKVLPEAVSSAQITLDASAPEYLTLAYGNLAGLFVEAIKELSAQITALQAQVTALTPAPAA